MKFTVTFRQVFKQIGDGMPEEITPEPVTVEGDRVIGESDGVLIVRDDEDTGEALMDDGFAMLASSLGNGVAWFAADCVRSVVPADED
jgi:hypothetical protein